MKSSPNWFVLFPLIIQMQLPMHQLNGIGDSRASNFSGYCIKSLVWATFLFFFIEWMWFIFRSQIVKSSSTYPFWREFLKKVLTSFKTSIVALGWILLVSVTWATAMWGGDFFTETSVAHLGFYLTLSLLLNFYLAALFSVWHLFLAPRLLAFSQTKGLNSSQ